MLGIAIKAAYSSNPLSVQIVDMLLQNGADFGHEELRLMEKGPQELSPILERQRFQHRV